MQVLLVPLQIDDRIADELTRAVKGDVPASFHLMQFDPTRLEHGWRGEQMPILRRTAEGDDRWMLHQKEQILAQLSTDPRPCHGAL